MAEGPQVAVVEDDSGSRKTLARLLRMGGFDPLMYASAEEYLSSPPASVPIGMLLDLHLGGMSGFELQQLLRSAGSTLPIIIISAYDDGRSRARARQLGCMAFLSKPCEAEAILELLRPLARRHEPGVSP